MAFGFTPKHIQELTVETLSSEEILLRGLASAKQLGWQIGTISAQGFLAFAKVSISSTGEQFSMRIDGQKIVLKSECISGQIVDWGKNKRNVETFISIFEETEVASNPEEIEGKHAALNLEPEASDLDLNSSPQSSREKITGFFAVFIPVEGYFITPIIINLNILLFILMITGGTNILLPDNETLINWGSNFKPLTLGGEWWRLISCCFVHIGIIHLLMNMYGLMYIGLLLEPYLGKDRFTVAYLLTGLTGSITSLYWYDLTVAAGASGAIFGMYGIFLAMLTTNLIEKSTRQSMLKSISIFVGYNLLSGLRGGVDNAAHIGGLVGGLVMGYAFLPSLLKPADDKIKNVTIGVLVLSIVGISTVVFLNMSNDIGTYDQRMNEFSTVEDKALSYYQVAEQAPKEQLPALRDSSMHHWQRCIAIMNETAKLELPEEIGLRNKKLLRYCELRVQLTDLFFKALQEGTNKYDEEMNESMEQINIVLTDLAGESER